MSTPPSYPLRNCGGDIDIAEGEIRRAWPPLEMRLIYDKVEVPHWEMVERSSIPTLTSDDHRASVYLMQLTGLWRSVAYGTGLVGTHKSLREAMLHAEENARVFFD